MAPWSTAAALFDFEQRLAPSTQYLKATHDLTTAPKASATTSTLALGEQYLLGVYARPPFVLSHGRGSWVWDTEDRKFLDFSAGTAVNSLGHADPGVAKVSDPWQSFTIFRPSYSGSGLAATSVDVTPRFERVPQPMGAEACAVDCDAHSTTRWPWLPCWICALPIGCQSLLCQFRYRS